MMHVGSLFSGVGGLDLGIERSGVGRVVWQCELLPFRRRVLAARFPGVPCYPDVERLLESTPPRVDMIVGGFPCQDLSVAGRKAGLEGSRSRLGIVMIDVVRSLRPKWVVMENAGHTRAKWLPHLQALLREAGYTTFPVLLPAADVGAPHERSRVFLIACLDEAPLAALQGYLTAASARPTARGEDGRWPDPPALAVQPHADNADRLAAVGDAVCVPCAELIGDMIGWAEKNAGGERMRPVGDALRIPRSILPNIVPALDASGQRLMLPTPTKSSYGSCIGGAAGRTGKVRHSLHTMASRQGGALNPLFFEWMMGFPPGWTRV